MSTPLALVHGDPLPDPPVPTLGEALRRAAGTGRGVTLVDGTGTRTRRSYARLRADAARVLAGIRRAGAAPGDTVLLRPARPADLLTAFWACVLGGLLPVPLAPDSELDELDEELGGAWLIGEAPPESGPALRRLGPVAGLRAPAGDPEEHRAAPGDPALLTLTSGSSGRPKAVVLTHRNVLSRAHASALARGLDEHTRTLNWLPLDHVSGIVMCHLRDVLLGCHQVHADTSWVRVEPLRWLDLAAAERIDTTWAPDHALGLLADRLAEPAGRSWDLTGLRYVMSGGEPVRDRTARRFLAALAPYGLPATALHPGWGMPETSAGVVDWVYAPPGPAARRYVPVGRPHPGFSLRVVDERGAVLPERVLGRLQVTGPSVTEHQTDGESVQFTDDGWLVTDDLAFVDGGLLTVTGRADDLIELAGTRYHGHEIEHAVEELPFVAPASTVARSYRDGRLAVFFRLRGGTPEGEAVRLVRELLLRRYGRVPEHVEALTGQQLARTATGKLRKRALADRLAELEEAG
ncbi:AMP-binding protein [Kitasatospora viridis]|uniref:Acyl-CoA synthetase (AMP-forming)/AMP-acid ligase II n=1 Tax=Kitasatospora viridis TaxID=281105 RepID=A0A561TTL2_9ACTN|nr:AMP-binding protein [Kitasatospora viridis]TWF90427.1 acyl-CoA synthetase (AMP-forming)/AMP-acid ligase II [Kitasatospora viridis]